MRAATALAGLIATLAGAAPAAGQAPGGVSHAGACDQAAVLVEVETARLAPYVPDGFPVTSVLGRSPLIVTGGRCEPNFVDGERTPANTWGLVVVLSSNPDDRFDTRLNGYDLWWLNSESRTTAAWHRLGIRSQAAPGMTYHHGPGTATVDAMGAPRFPFRVEVDRVDGPAPAFEVDTLHWHIGPLGRVLVDPHHTDFDADGGVGRVVAPAGSPLAQVMGRQAATGAAATFSFSFRGDYGPG